MQRLAKLLLVFWSIFILELGTSFNLIALFDIIVIGYFQDDFFRSFWSDFSETCIDLSSEDIRIRVFRFALSFWNIFFKDFYIFVEIIYNLRFLGLDLKLFDFYIFYGNILDLHFGCSNRNWTILLLDLIVNLSSIKSRLETYFSLSFNRFLNYLFLSILFSIFDLFKILLRA